MKLIILLLLFYQLSSIEVEVPQMSEQTIGLLFSQKQLTYNLLKQMNTFQLSNLFSSPPQNLPSITGSNFRNSSSRYPNQLSKVDPRRKNLFTFDSNPDIAGDLQFIRKQAVTNDIFVKSSAVQLNQQSNLKKVKQREPIGPEIMTNKQSHIFRNKHQNTVGQEDRSFTDRINLNNVTQEQLQAFQREDCEKCKSLEKQIKELNKLYSEQTSKIIDQSNTVKYDVQLRILQTQVAQLQSGNELLSAKLDVHNCTIQTLAKERDQLKEQLSKVIVPQKLNLNLTTLIESMRSSSLQMKRNLQCKLCHNYLTNAVTVIPCAHSYCQECKKGYQKQCYICGPSLPIEAAYHNIYMEELLKMYNLFSDSILILQQTTSS